MSVLREYVTKIMQHGYAMCNVSVTWTTTIMPNGLFREKNRHCSTSTVFMDIVNCLAHFFWYAKGPVRT